MQKKEIWKNSPSLMSNVLATRSRKQIMKVAGPGESNQSHHRVAIWMRLEYGLRGEAPQVIALSQVATAWVFCKPKAILLTDYEVSLRKDLQSLTT
jgi:hypothetical protein